MSIEVLAVGLVILVLTLAWVGAPLLRREKARAGTDALLQKRKFQKDCSLLPARSVLKKETHY